MGLKSNGVVLDKQKSVADAGLGDNARLICEC